MIQFENHGLRGGVWSGTLTADKKPTRVFLMQYDEIVSFARLKAKGQGCWQVAVDIPASMLSDGAHSLGLFTDEGDGEAGPSPDAVRLDHLRIIAGRLLDDDLTAEVELLRAELEFLKSEFRRFASREQSDT